MKYQVIEKGDKYFAQVSEDGGFYWYSIDNFDWSCQESAEAVCKRHKKKIEQVLAPERVVWTMEE